MDYGGNLIRRQVLEQLPGVLYLGVHGWPQAFRRSEYNAPGGNPAFPSEISTNR
jgi:hypothetical protein